MRDKRCRRSDILMSIGIVLIIGFILMSIGSHSIETELKYFVRLFLGIIAKGCLILR